MIPSLAMKSAMVPSPALRFAREVIYLIAFAQLGVLSRAYLGRCTASPLSFPGANFFPDMPANVIG